VKARGSNVISVTRRIGYPRWVVRDIRVANPDVVDVLAVVTASLVLAMRHLSGGSLEIVGAEAGRGRVTAARDLSRVRVESMVASAHRI